MKRFLPLLSVLLVAIAAADEHPSWAVTDAVDHLVAKNALFLPGRDAFAKSSDGSLTQYEMPGRSYQKDGSGWQVDLLCRRWRKKESRGWAEWTDARPRGNEWEIGKIHVEVMTRGVTATWVNPGNFAGATAPGEAEVMRQLDNRAQRPAITPAVGNPAAADTSSDSNTPPVTRLPAGPGGLPYGMSRPLPRMAVPQPAGTTSPQASAPPSSPNQPPLHRSNPTPVPTGGATATIASAKPGTPADLFKPIMPLVIGAVVFATILSELFKKSKRSRSRRPRSGKTVRQAPPIPPAPRSGTSSSSANPVDAIQLTDNLLTPAELAFFATLEPLVHSSYRISCKVRLADLFDAKQGPGQQAAFNRIVGKHIDFVITDSATSRIVCGIELDDSSHRRSDRIQRDRFVNELFARHQRPLLRIPFSWTYYAAGLRAELAKASLTLPPEI